MRVCFKVKDYKQVEKILHNAFSDYRINPSREFFDVSPERIIPILKYLQIEDTTISIGNKINEIISETDKESNTRYIKRRPNFNFIEMGINIGELIIFAKMAIRLAQDQDKLLHGVS